MNDFTECVGSPNSQGVALLPAHAEHKKEASEKEKLKECVLLFLKKSTTFIDRLSVVSTIVSTAQSSAVSTA